MRQTKSMQMKQTSFGVSYMVILLLHVGSLGCNCSRVYLPDSILSSSYPVTGVLVQADYAFEN